MIRRVLVALDGSPRAPDVLRAAAEIAGRFGATLTPLRAILVPPEFPAAAAGSSADPLPEHLTHAAIEEIAALTAGARVSTAAPVVGVGQPWRVIVEAAERLDADLVVVGSHGYRGLDRVLGTTAGKVANHSSRNVLVVHARTESATAGASPASGPYRA